MPTTAKTTSQTGRRKQKKEVLLRFREQDSENGISFETFEKLMQITEMNKTELLHKALRIMVKQYIAPYEQDDGPLSEQQYEALKKMSPVSNVSEEEMETLFTKD
ncbi:hypothetical protein [Brenneria corticis]|uniref:Uncharacterized protein n=1 Tax=Brenneria corticis TaxID=2173106 RepID=A0A2U1UCX0_9GAMM|nr:hypothetical protein [Brenneria sp. CFCC 11842]PWC19526.1 hypothetical protein DDT56_00695 [Brenneria sp. CFCC 11842]